MAVSKEIRNYLRQLLVKTKAQDLMTPPLRIAMPDTPVSWISGQMRLFSLWAVPVVSDGQFRGMVTAQSLVRARVSSQAKADSLRVSAPLLEPQTPLSQACTHMADESLLVIPVGANGKLHGVLTFHQIVDWLKGLRGMNRLKVRDLPLRPARVPDSSIAANIAKVLLRDPARDTLLLDDSDHLEWLEETFFAASINRFPKKRMHRGDRAGEKHSRLSVSARFWSNPMGVEVTLDTPLRVLFDQLVTYHRSLARVDGQVVHFRDILHFAASLPSNRVALSRVQVVSKTRWSKPVRRLLAAELRSFESFVVRKFGSTALQELKIYIKTSRKSGAQNEYELSAKLNTDFGVFVAKKHGWNIRAIWNSALSGLRTQLLRKTAV